MHKEDFELDSKNNEYKISTTLYLPESKEAKKIIIALHGFGGDKISTAIVMLAKSLTKHNIGVITFDFPGHGDSTTSGYNFKVENCINDVEIVENYINKRFNGVDVGIFATSYGAYITLLYISKNNKRYSDVVLRCPALNMKEVFEEKILLNESLDSFLEKGKTILGYDKQIIITKEWYNELVANDIFSIESLNNNVLIIHGTADDMAPPKYSKKLQDTFKDKVTIEYIEGADHRFKKPGELDKVISIATEYIIRK